MIKAKIVDPVKVTRSALKNAASIAALVLTTESLVSDIPEENNAKALHASTWYVLILNFAAIFINYYKR